MVEKQQYDSTLIKSTLIIRNRIQAVYLIDGTKINLIWDETNSPSINIEKTPLYTTSDWFKNELCYNISRIR